MNSPISFELAKLLKEKGHDIKSPKGYYTHGDTQLLLWVDSEEWNNQKDFIAYAPTVAEVVMWLYDNHEIWITVEGPVKYENDGWASYVHKTYKYGCLYGSHIVNSIDEAYESAIEYVLNNLL